MPIIRGRRVVLRDVRREDADVMSRWPRFVEPELQWANVTLRTPGEKEAWYRHEQSDWSRLRLAITNEDGELIGLMGLRDVDRRGGTATLGIRMSANHVGTGYGTDAITALLGYAFTEMQLLRVNLDVAANNPRAQRCYVKCGFSVTGRHRGFDNVEYIDMAIKREEFERRFVAERPLETKRLAAADSTGATADRGT
ncbi:MAG: GNAT family N-acetyltransferase [Chloroflexi bacterium]|nr:GNAT family N-acetyltransferase [Chloroflexota bacterium]